MAVEELRAKLEQAARLLRKAGGMLEVQGDQKARALRFKILNFLKELEE